MYSQGAALGRVDAWSSPTAIWADRGQLAHWCAQAPPGAMVITDAQVTGGNTYVQAALAKLAAPETVLVTSAPAREQLPGLIAKLTQSTAAVVALGGGRVLDLARLAAHCAKSPQSYQAIVAQTGGGALFLPSDPSVASRVVCVPSTIGTAAEVSPIAVVADQEGTLMVASPALRPHLAILDPGVTASLSRSQLAQGLIEPFSRLLIPVAQGSSIDYANLAGASLLDIGRRIFATIVKSAALSDQQRLSLALWSSNTHISFTALGHRPMTQLLWPLATELAGSLQLPKTSTMAWLMQRWLAGLASDQLPSPFGSAGQLSTSTGVDVSQWQQLWQQLMALSNLAEVNPDVVTTQAEAIVATTITRWGSPHLFNLDTLSHSLQGLLTG